MNRYFLEAKATRGPILPPSKSLAQTAMATKVSMHKEVQLQGRMVTNGDVATMEESSAPTKQPFLAVATIDTYRNY